MPESQVPREMTGAELKSMLKSTINLKSLGGVKDESLKLGEEDLQWWRDAKFGMFIHWGLYSILGRGEWVMHNEQIPVDEYRKLADQLRPENFDADTWAELAEQGGMQYMVMVARHHDGFALWDSPGSVGSFTSAATGARRDFISEYTQACRRHGLRVGIYYSPMDWRFPGYFKPRELPDNALLMKKQAYDQVEELMSRYGTIDILWYDGAWLAHDGHDPDAAWLWEPVKLNQMARTHNPKVVINPRSGWEGDFYCDEGSHEIKGGIVPVPWEKNLCICSGTSWGWIPNDPVMSFDDAIRMFVNVFVRDGNVLLNVGPDKDGVIPAAAATRIRQIGSWMQTYGESVYGTRGGPFEPEDNVFGSTFKDNYIYLHVLDPVRFGKRSLEMSESMGGGRVVDATILGPGHAPVAWNQRASTIQIDMGAHNSDAVDTIVRLELDRPVVSQQASPISFVGS
jgi:alpha-L-fucosidase